MSALVVYDAALTDRADEMHLGVGSRWRTIRLTDWYDGRAGDTSLVDRCAGATLDVGCGPGRLTAALAGRGVDALGVDIAPAAVRLARRRGVTALRRSVFHTLPAEGHWRHVLLADGNIGIGGDPVRLLRRCAGLTAPGGTILVELDPPGSPTGAATLRLRYAGRQSAPFRWAYVAADALPAAAERAGLAILENWTEAGRWFAALHCR